MLSLVLAAQLTAAFLETPTHPDLHKVSGQVTTADGHPVEGIDVWLSPQFDTQPGETEALFRRLRPDKEQRYWLATTGQDGNYEFTGVPAFCYSFRVNDVRYGEVPGKIRIEKDLQQNFLLNPGVNLGGAATSSDGSPVTLELFRSERDAAEMFRLYRDRELTTHSGGRFLFRGIEPGYYWLFAKAEGHGTEQLHVEVQRSIIGKRIKLAPGVPSSEDIFPDEEQDLDRMPVALTFAGPKGSAWVDGQLVARHREHCLTEGVRLIPGKKKASHQRYVGGKRGFESGDSVRLDLVPGEWDLFFEAGGFAPWSKTFNVEGPMAVSAELRQLPGRILHAEFIGHSLVEVRASHTGAPWRPLLDHSRDTGLWSSTLPPCTAWLPPGTFDLRVSSYSRADMILEEVHIATSGEPFVVPASTEIGLYIQGTIQSNARRGHQHDLFLYRLEDSGWTEQKCKRTSSSHDLASGKLRFCFPALTPGEYRASLDSQGEIVLGQWTLKDRNIEDQQLTHTFR